ncbi:cation:proton antiporter domain-containing protein [Psittacicella hinzii]|uniref:cation:proton antiporter domain-containing protein n=1 Tax=Psittacicella hinzii TaxID=2028575 RepID=UPI001CA700B5|nr:cation:proton antiporter [Psittacicella hinzii]
MHHDTPLISIIAIGFMLSYIFGMIANRLKLSPIIGYLFAGILLGPNVSFVYNADLELANQISEVGVMLLMFGVGLHFSVKDLNEVKSIAVPGAIAQVVGTIAVTTLIGHLMGHSWFNSAIFGLCLSVASTVVLLRALEDNSITQTPRGKIAVGWLIVEDLMTVVVLVVLPTMQFMTNGTEMNLAQFGMDMFWTAVKFAAFVFVMFFFGGKLIPMAISRSAATGSSELFTLATLAIALGIAYIAVEVFNVSYALGAFFAGMILNGSELSHRAADNTLPLRDAFAVLFFVSVGMLFNYNVILTNPLGVIYTAVIILLVKSAIAYALIRIMGKSNRTALTISVSLAQIGEFSFILAGLAVGYGYLDSGQKDLILAGAIISIILNPFLFVGMEKFLQRFDARLKHNLENMQARGGMHHTEAAPEAVAAQTKEARPGQAQVEAATHEKENLHNPEHEVISGASSIIPLPEDKLVEKLEGDQAFVNEQVLMSKHTIVVGYSSIGKAIVARLNATAMPVIVITNNLDEFYETNREGIHTIFGDFKNIAHFEQANVKEAKAIIFTNDNVFEIGYTVDKIFNAHPELFANMSFTVSAMADFPDEIEFLEKHHVTDIINLREVASLVLFSSVVKEDTQAELNTKGTDNNYHVRVSVDTPNSPEESVKRKILADKAQALVNERKAKEKAKAAAKAEKEAQAQAQQAHAEAEKAQAQAKQASQKAEKVSQDINAQQEAATANLQANEKATDTSAVQAEQAAEQTNAVQAGSAKSTDNK